MPVFLALLLAMAFCGPGAFAASVTVELRPESAVAVGEVRLFQIAEIKGDSGLAAKIGTTLVTKLAKPGRETRVSRSVLETTIKRNGFSAKEFDLKGATTATLRARAQLIEQDSIHSLLLEAVRTQLPGLKEGVDWELDASRLPKSVEAPEKNGALEAQLSPRFAGRGQETATLLVLMDGQVIHRQTVSFVVKRWENVLKLARAIHKAEVLDSASVELTREETTFQQRKLLFSVEQAVGRSAMRNLREGELLVDNWLSTPYAVREGDQVRLFVSVGGATVQAQGIAKQSGFKGETIRVLNADTRKELLATITGPGEAQVQ
jgi:flagella basal body P-ring formation protein FlgA